MYNHKSQCHCYKDNDSKPHCVFYECTGSYGSYALLSWALAHACSRVSRHINRTREQALPHRKVAPTLHFHLRECVLESAGMYMILQSCPR